MPTKDPVQLAFIITWLVLAAGSALFYFFASPETKRKTQAIHSIGVSTLFLGFVAAMSGVPGLLFAVVLVCLIAFLNIKAVIYCPKCGSYNRSPTLFPLPKYCRKCGTVLDDTAIGRSAHNI